mmetsp:Transcript_16749/g.39790  ORF Transcript_16749/g.39790 Transcript_16749/m.39790 type:complete len:174 (+) Transcript_16749:57-578(+)
MIDVTLSSGAALGPRTGAETGEEDSRNAALSAALAAAPISSGMILLATLMAPALAPPPISARLLLAPRPTPLANEKRQLLTNVLHLLAMLVVAPQCAAISLTLGFSTPEPQTTAPLYLPTSAPDLKTRSNLTNCRLLSLSKLQTNSNASLHFTGESSFIQLSKKTSIPIERPG